ncbi:MAG: endopeptidase La [Candidatus Sumerlaeota bacterium]|nr:endopeptidase La [Candidatus Sumerlaeota bacterium]
MKSLDSMLLPVIPLKDLVVFPHTFMPLFLTRPASIKALDAAAENNNMAFLVAQKREEIEDPAMDDLYAFGTISEIKHVIKLPDGSVKALAEGKQMARAESYLAREDYFTALATPCVEATINDKKLIALVRVLKNQFERYVALSPRLPDEVFLSVRGVEDPLLLVSAIANYSLLSVMDKQHILEEPNTNKKCLLMTRLLGQEVEMLEVESNIIDQVKSQIGKSQKEYFLNEQMRAIERELGVNSETESELDELAKAVEKAGMSVEAREKAAKELARLSRMQPMSPEATVARTFVEWLAELPWTKRTEDQLDLERAQKILDEDHYGLHKVKERIIEYLAVLSLSKEMKGPILCLVGPPGVGKSSLARSIARAIDRKFARISLGGVRDEAEIRGHRRTYIGSLPGKILQSMKKAGTINPVLLMDEIDKLSSDFRGDPAAALLEVLDPEQNKTFNDHYLEVDYDLSHVMFITTANTTDATPPALLDRMEVLRLPGYTEQEKHKIAQQFLIPKQAKANGLGEGKITFTSEAIQTIIVNYTREAGVRNLEREIATVCRKMARDFVRKKQQPRQMVVTVKRVRASLGPVRHKDMELHKPDEIGVVTGLAWTETGGELLPIETIVMKGKGDLQLTGHLGEVMQESAKAALSYVRAHCEEFGIDPEFKSKFDIHVHVPEGAIPKDGPSAGVAMATSLVSALAQRPVRQDIAMTGEITLRGRVLKIGGLKEKALAAHRAHIKRIIIPEDNVSDLQEIEKDVRKQMKFVPVKTLSEVFKVAFT